jgi:hypothetical protein
MGANATKTVSKITNDISNQIDNSSTSSAIADCSIKSGNIILRRAKNCQVIDQNKCGASASSVIDATVDAAVAAFNTATTEQKTNLLPGINSSSTEQEIKTAIRNTIIQKCQSDAKIRDEIINRDIILEDCENSNIQNINVGDATALCGIKTVMKAATDTKTESKSTQSTGSLLDAIGFGNMGGYSTYGIVASSSSCVCCILIILVLVFFFYMK